MVYSQLVFFNVGSAEVLVILVRDFYLLNLEGVLKPKYAAKCGNLPYSVNQWIGN